MSDPIHHHCGIAMIRLKRPFAELARRQGTPLFAFHKLFLLMEKQHNRGQEGAGIGCVKLGMPLGAPYMFRDREARRNPLQRLFERHEKAYFKAEKADRIVPEFPETAKTHFDFAGELLIGHLRYGTSGGGGTDVCHPYARRSNWPTRNLLLAGNFNMTNTGALNEALIGRGQHPVFETDTQTVIEEIGFHLDEAHETLYRRLRDKGLKGMDLQRTISDRMDPVSLVRDAAKVWDGGYTIAGLIGNGDAFVLRDPHGIRPGFYLETDDLIAVASERVPLMTVLDCEQEAVQELPPGHVLSIKADGRTQLARFADPKPRAACSFERIYFSRGNDPEIYRERKALGAALAPRVDRLIDGDLANAVFSFIPNTAEVASYGLTHALRQRRREAVRARFQDARHDGTLADQLDTLLDELILNNWPRVEKVAHKDQKLRTFIAQESGRNRLVSHVYDITYGVVEPADTLVVLDDSIVRGTTLRTSILRILSRTKPKRIIVASTAPQIRFPDCYGIDMSQLGKFVAFEAAVALTNEHAPDRMQRVYEACQAELKKPAAQQENRVKDLYAPFSPEAISARIAELLYPRDVPWQGDLTIVYQRIEDLHHALPEHTGDWYFTGNYPTPGGTAVCNQAFVNYMENNEGRSY